MKTGMQRKKLLVLSIAISLFILTFVINLYILGRIKAALSKTITPTDTSDSAAPFEPSAAIDIVRQPENRLFVPGGCVTLSLRAQGSDLHYQWYYRKPGEKDFSPWNGHTHASESVAPPDSWDGIELYCTVGEADGHSVRSDTITVSRGDTLSVLGVGDSICSGRRNGSKGFVGDLGLPYLNAGVSGSSLSTVRTDVTTIPDQLMQVTDFDPDIVIAEGGLNDLYRNAPLGEIPTVQADSMDALDTSTVMGGMQKLFLIMKEKYPDAQHCFLIVHKIFRKGVYLVDTPNQAGYSQTDMHDAFVACCRVYGIEVIDIFKDSPLDTSDLSLLSECNYTSGSDPEWECARSNDTDYINGDGVHPLNRCYLEYYVPIILQHIHTQVQKLAITSQPQDVEIMPGDSFLLSIEAEGTGLRCQWYYKKEGQDSFRVWNGHTFRSEIITPNSSWDGIQLYCEVTDKFGHSLQSDVITVRMAKEPQ